MENPALVLLATYLTQAVEAFFLAAALFTFYRFYQRDYLRQWSLSWLALGLYMSAAAAAFYFGPPLPRWHPMQVALGTAAIISAYWMSAWLLFGAYEISTHKTVSRRFSRIVLAGLVLFALGTMLLRIAVSDPAGPGFFTRSGVHLLITGMTFFVAAWALRPSQKGTTELGRTLITASFLVYGLQQVNYFIRNLSAGRDASGFTVFLGFLDILLLAIMGMGMVIWLLEEERARVLSASQALTYSEEQLRRSQKMEAVGRLAGGIAHDFNNLLTVIMGYSTLILDSLKFDDPIYREVREILRAAERGSSLNRQLLAFSRQQVLQPKILDLNSTVIEMDKMLRRLIGEDIELVTLLDPELGPVRVDPGQVEQVIANLVVNARDAMPQGGRLILETANIEVHESLEGQLERIMPGSYVTMAVHDSGMGMDDETLARIFEPFYTTKEKGKGTGLGLSMVYGIIRQSGGNILVNSKFNQGSTFRIFLPRVEGLVEKAALNSFHSHSLQGSETILLVEDEDPVRELACEVLQHRGYTVLAAADGVDAIDLGASHSSRIDLMVTDVIMPHMSGPELAQKLIQVRPYMKVLFMSGYADDALERAGLGDDMAFLQKPFSPDSLASKIREVLDS